MRFSSNDLGRRRRSSITVINRRRTGVLHASHHIALSIRARDSRGGERYSAEKRKGRKNEGRRRRWKALDEGEERPTVLEQVFERVYVFERSPVCVYAPRSRSQLSRIYTMAVSLTEWRFARPADALPPSGAPLARSLASRSSLCFLRNLSTYRNQAPLAIAVHT